jgi:general secretion pathway protein D
VDKIPLLGQIPILGRLFSNDNGSKAKNEIILSITPHIVGNAKLPDAREMEYWSGTESALKSTQLTLKPLGVVSLTNSGMTRTEIPSSPMPTLNKSQTNQPQLDKPQPDKTLEEKPVADKALADKTTAIKPKEAAMSSAMSLSWQGPSQGKIGDKLSIALNTQSTQGVKSLGFNIEFDPSVLKAIDVVEGDAMKRNNSSSTFTKKIDQEAGEVAVDLVGKGAGGAGKLFTLTFEVISTTQESIVSLSSLSAMGENGESITLQSPEPHVISVAQ